MSRNARVTCRRRSLLGAVRLAATSLLGLLVVAGASAQPAHAASNFVSLGQPVSGTFFNNPFGVTSGTFDFSQVNAPLWSQNFQQALFNVPQYCTNNTGDTGQTRPFTELSQAFDGSCAPVAAQGNGLQAGVGSLQNFEAAFTANLYVPVAGNVQLYLAADDGSFIGSGPVAGGTAQPTYVSGVMNNPPAGTALKNYPVVGGNNGKAGGGFFTVNFPQAGVYPIEIDYTECCGDGLQLVFANADGTAVAPRGFPAFAPPESWGSNGGPGGLENNTRCRTPQPVDCATGNFTHTFADVSVPGRGLPLLLSRTYNSLAASAKGLFGYGWTSSYEMSLSLNTFGDATVHQEDGAQATFMSNGSGGFTAPAKVLGSLVKNADGTYTLTRRGRQKFTFSSAGVLQSESDLNGYTETLSYNGSGQLSTVTDAAGRTLSLGYGSNGLVASVNDPAGRSVSYGYDTNGNLTSAKDVNGGTTQFGYDSNHLLTTLTDARNDGSLQNTYDSLGRVTQQLDAMNRKTTFSYGSVSNSGSSSTTVTDPKGNATVENYTNGVLTSLTNAAGTSSAATWQYGYDPTLGVSSVTDPNNHTWTYGYDTNGNQTSAKDPLGHTTSRAFNAFDEPTSVKDQLGVTTTYSYDGSGNLQSVSTPLTSTGQTRTTTYTYGDASHPGDVTAITDPNGKVSRYAYDAVGNLTSSSDPLGDKTTYGYGCSGGASAGCYPNIGLLYSVVSPRGNVSGGNPSQFTTSDAYNAFGEPTSVTDQLAHVTKYVYDADGNLTQTTDPNSHQTAFTYDADNELTKVTRANTTTLLTGFDGDGNVSSQTDAANNQTLYGYDALNHLSSVTDPLQRKTSYVYDAVGNLQTVTDALGRVTTDSYDAANRLIGRSYSDGQTPPVSFGYDNDNQLTSMSDGFGSATYGYSYDSLSRLTGVTDSTLGTIGYGYDLAGNETSITYPNGKSITRVFDDASRLSAVKDWLAATTTFGYDANSNLTTITFPSGTTDQDTYSYDNADRVSSVAMNQGAKSLATASYTRDNLGQLATISLNGGKPTSNAYDSINRLTSAGSNAFAYDNADNPTQQNGRSGYAFDTANELTGLSASKGLKAVTYSYDSLGERTSNATGGTTTSYGYNEAQQLKSFTAPNITDTYAYDGHGLQTARTHNGSATHLAWDQSTSLPTVLDDGQASIIYGPGGLPVEQIDRGNNPMYFHHDQQGSSTLLTGATGATSGAASYTPFGVASTSNTTTPFGYDGQYTDPDTGLINLRARQYDPATSQFVTRDPADQATREAYVYANDNPSNNSDPTGLYVTPDPCHPYSRVVLPDNCEPSPQASTQPQSPSVSHNYPPHDCTAENEGEIYIDPEDGSVWECRYHPGGNTYQWVPRGKSGLPATPSPKLPPGIGNPVTPVVTPPLLASGLPSCLEPLAA